MMVGFHRNLVRNLHYFSIFPPQVDIETPRVTGTIPMIRVRNPWGDEHEWQGAFSDQ